MAKQCLHSSTRNTQCVLDEDHKGDCDFVRPVPPGHRVCVDSGKYTFVLPEGTNRVEIFRHNEPWHAQEKAFNALHSMMCELDAARVVVATAREFPGDGAMILRALRAHDALVDDHEPPSRWTGSPPPAPAQPPLADAARAWATARAELDRAAVAAEACAAALHQTDAAGSLFDRQLRHANARFHLTSTRHDEEIAAAALLAAIPK